MPEVKLIQTKIRRFDPSLESSDDEIQPSPKRQQIQQLPPAPPLKRQPQLQPPPPPPPPPLPTSTTVHKLKEPKQEPVSIPTKQQQNNIQCSSSTKQPLKNLKQAKKQKLAPPQMPTPTPTPTPPRQPSRGDLEESEESEIDKQISLLIKSHYEFVQAVKKGFELKSELCKKEKRGTWKKKVDWDKLSSALDVLK